MTEPLRYPQRVVPFTAGDGMALNLLNVRGPGSPSRGPVLLVHGAGSRGNIFRAPVPSTLVDVLVGEGYDVWLENWRASTDVAPNEWTLDQAAVHDHPAAVRTVLAQTGAARLKAITHCQGATSFTMAAIAGLLPEVDTIVTNAVSLHVVVPWWSRQKLRFAVPLLGGLTTYVDPGWGKNPPNTLARALRLFVRATHHECDNDVCKMVSFTYGAGFPALWRHENLNKATHDDFIPAEFGNVPMSFFRQIAHCARRGHLVRVDDKLPLPEDFAACEPQTGARFVFLVGEQNRTFLPVGQRRSHEHFSRFRPDYHALHVFKDYGHLDIFMGEHASRDVFPTILEELERGEATGAQAAVAGSLG